MFILTVVLKILFTAVTVLLLLMLHALESKGYITPNTSQVLKDIGAISTYISLTLVVSLAIMHRKFFSISFSS